MRDQGRYWDRVANGKTFTHPLNARWLARWAPQSASLLDYGCGYGRILSDLAGLGYANAIGIDRSAPMIERGRRENPAFDLRVMAGSSAPLPGGGFDLVLLFSVLTCIVSDGEQRSLIADVVRLLRPGGLLYLSDTPLQADPRNLARYEMGAEPFGVYGVFATEDGGVLRHHAEKHLDDLLAGLELVERETIAISTVNLNPATAVQILARKSG